MSNELEQRLQRVLEMVGPSEPATEQARAAALSAAAGSGLRSRYRLALVAAALVGALVITGVTLAASRTVREAVGIADPPRAHQQPPADRGPLPPGSGGFAVYGGGRLWLASPSLNVANRAYSAAELSPGAINMAAGSGHSLDVVRLSDGSIAWSHATAGRVVAAAWAPIGTEIAYVVESHGAAQLHVIEGDGDHDRLIAGSVSPVKPSWRADSLALAYAAAGGQVVVRDLAAGRTTVVHSRRCVGRTAQVAFAPRGDLLAASVANGGLLVTDPARGWVACTAATPFLGQLPPPLLAWISGRELVASVDQMVARKELRGHRIVAVAEAQAPYGISGLTVSPDRRQIAVGLWRDDRLQVVVAEMPRPGDTALRIVRILRDLPNPSAAHTLIWR
jgi:hypothetical protein